MEAGTISVASVPGWPTELAELYAREHTQLVRTAYLICGSVPRAEDAVHDAMVRVRDKWTIVDRGRSYLYVAVVNAARDAMRRTRRDARLPDDAGVGDDPAELSVESIALRDALARIPENHRTALVLRYFADWDDDEIAFALGARPATVRSWVHRGLSKLQQEMPR
jgi:RNA polymerase sigma factor (sigma-70 family)